MQPADLVLPEIREVLTESPGELAESLEDFHPVDVAEVYRRLNEDEAKAFVTALPIDLLTSVFEVLERHERMRIIPALPSGRAAKLIEWMSPDDRTDFLQELPAETREALLATIDRNIVREVRALLNYAPDTAGGLMTTEFLKVPETYTVDQTLALVRRLAGEQEMIYTLFVVDSDSGKLTGVMSLRDVLMANGSLVCSDIMTSQIITVRYDAPQSEVAEIISKYDLLSLPVVDTYGRLLGIVTIDDVLDVVKEQRTEDIQRMGAMQPIEQSYFETPFFSLVKKRAAWLILLFVGELFTTNALEHFQGALQGAIALTFFVPLIVSSGGNSGSQSATLVIRSLTMGELTRARAIQMIIREAGTGLALGLFLGSVGFIRALFLGQGALIALTIGLTLVMVVSIGAAIGAALPLLLRRAGFDPAVSSTPFIASLVDVVGIVTYFTLAKLILSLPG
ncbi:MAG: magnesium transporter [Deltaproteobacteria bacterium]|nr:magnesium transporter [Deltaproteobacteria bacterium]